MFTAVLVAHIIGGFATIAVSLWGAVALWRGEMALRRIAIILGILAGVEMATGSLLAALSATISAAMVCERILIYLPFVGLVELLLYLRLRKLAQEFPTTQVTSSVSA